VVSLEKLKKDLKQDFWYCITADCWSSLRKDEYICYTYHYVKDGKLEQRVLGVRNLDEVSIDNISIQKATNELFQQLKLEKKSVLLLSLMMEERKELHSI